MEHQMEGYAAFLQAKAQKNTGHGFEPLTIPDHLFDYQKELTAWSIRQGRSAIFADCGMGKTFMELAWATNVHRKTGKPVLLLTPLAVGRQIVTEGERYGYEASQSRNGKVSAPITVSNYEQAAKFNPADFGGVVCDESSAIKAFDGSTRAIVTELMREMPYRLLGTATAAPNDYLELGTSSEALGELGYMDMLGRFFVNDQRTSTHRPMGGNKGDGKLVHGTMDGYRFKGHAEGPFWRWVSSWARAIRKPSDYGYSDDGFHLPELIENLHVVESSIGREDTLFDVPAIGLAEERAELRRSLPDRCEKAAELATAHDISVIWCNLNDEGDLLERLIPRSIQIKGSDSADVKEKAAAWFKGELCICNDRDFRSKLAAWHGNQSTQKPAAASTTMIQRNASGGSLNPELGRITPSTCASTTSAIPTSTPRRPNRRLSTTGVDGSATQLIPSTANGSNARHAQESTQSADATRAYESSSGSVPLNATSSSKNKGEDARSAKPSSATATGSGSPSTTTTQQGQSGDYCVPTATKVSGSLGMTPIDLNAPGCTCGHIDGQRRLISKASIFGWGLNFQHCSHIVYFPTHSYESFYQAVRRCWRFGQKEPVTVDVVATPSIEGMLANLQRKSEQADRMFDHLLAHMTDALRIQRQNDHVKEMELPSWAM